jgi:hypothetical protein
MSPSKKRLNVVEDDEIDTADFLDQVVDKPLPFRGVERHHVGCIVPTKDVKIIRRNPNPASRVGKARLHQAT